MAGLYMNDGQLTYRLKCPVFQGIQPEVTFDRSSYLSRDLIKAGSGTRRGPHWSPNDFPQSHPPRVERQGDGNCKKEKSTKRYGKFLRHKDKSESPTDDSNWVREFERGVTSPPAL
ncbi:hypothetical protein TNCV_454801 [Trichonephila clavipes]|nr:hypothetical protein TNCV_454801 [Trichonephila clavipes]